MKRLRFESSVLAFGFAIAGVYAAIAIVVGLMNSRTDVAVVCTIMSMVIAGPLILVSRMIEPPHEDGPSGDGPGGGPGPAPPEGGGGDQPDPWDEFERAFWQYVDAQAERAHSAAQDRGSRTLV